MFGLISIFFSIFLAELGDKTQITAMLFASQGGHKPLTILFVSCLALCLSTTIAVSIGYFGQEYIKHIPIKLISGIIFILLGFYNIYEYYKG